MSWFYRNYTRSDTRKNKVMTELPQAQGSFPYQSKSTMQSMYLISPHPISSPFHAVSNLDDSCKLLTTQAFSYNSCEKDSMQTWNSIKCVCSNMLYSISPRPLSVHCKLICRSSSQNSDHANTHMLLCGALYRLDGGGGNGAVGYIYIHLSAV